MAIEPKSKDQEKLGVALSSLSEEDPTFHVKSDEETGQTILWNGRASPRGLERSYVARVPG